ncbi:MAG: recombinase family protein [Thermodesulfobacteriota bacterium]
MSPLINRGRRGRRRYRRDPISRTMRGGVFLIQRYRVWVGPIGYIRVSTEDQAKEGVSLDNQRSKITAYCQLKDLDLSEIVEDAGISAKNLRRPGVQKVLRLAQKRAVDAVGIYKLEPESRVNKVTVRSPCKLYVN